MLSPSRTRRFNSRNSASAASPRRLCSSGVISGTSGKLLRRRGCFAVTIANLRSSSAGGGATFAGLATRLCTIAGAFSAAAFRFLGGRL